MGTKIILENEQATQYMNDIRNLELLKQRVAFMSINIKFCLNDLMNAFAGSNPSIPLLIKAVSDITGWTLEESEVYVESKFSRKQVPMLIPGTVRSIR